MEFLSRTFRNNFIFLHKKSTMASSLYLLLFVDLLWKINLLNNDIKNLLTFSWEGFEIVMYLLWKSVKMTKCLENELSMIKYPITNGNTL